MPPSWLPPPDGSRDRRVEDPTNLYLVHLAGRMLLPLALHARISANLISLVGFALGAGGAAAFFHWGDWRQATLGFCLGVGWLIADGLDGMIARATRTASAFGRFLDGLCDHGVFLLIYLSLAASLGTAAGWWLAVAAGAAHAVQATLYEGERTRFHRRLRGETAGGIARPSGYRLVRLYDVLAGSFDRLSADFDRSLRAARDGNTMLASYGACAARPLKLMALLSNNARLVLIYLACLAGDPRWFWLIELTLLTAIAAFGIVRLRTIERRMARASAG
jgi:CDP-diacylglycerol---serine O-phosphatidyltransferase